MPQPAVPRVNRIIADHIDLCAIDAFTPEPGMAWLYRASRPERSRAVADLEIVTSAVDGSLVVRGLDPASDDPSWDVVFPVGVPGDVVGAAIEAWVLR